MKENDYQSYRVLLKPAGGREVFDRAGLIPRGKESGMSLMLTVPAAKFATGD